MLQCLHYKIMEKLNFDEEQNRFLSQHFVCSALQRSLTDLSAMHCDSIHCNHKQQQKGMAICCLNSTNFNMFSDAKLYKDIWGLWYVFWTTFLYDFTDNFSMSASSLKSQLKSWKQDQWDLFRRRRSRSATLVSGTGFRSVIFTSSSYQHHQHYHHLHHHQVNLAYLYVKTI